MALAAPVLKTLNASRSSRHPSRNRILCENGTPSRPIVDHVAVHPVPVVGVTLMTADEVAEVLGMPRSSVYEYILRAERTLPSIAVGAPRF
jgi:hypothetical protein